MYIINFNLVKLIYIKHYFSNFIENKLLIIKIFKKIKINFIFLININFFFNLFK